MVYLFCRNFAASVIFGVANLCLEPLFVGDFFEIFDSVVIESLPLVKSVFFIFGQDFFDLFLIVIWSFVFSLKSLFTLFLLAILIFVLSLELLFLSRYWFLFYC